MRIIDYTPSSKVAKLTECHNCGVMIEWVPADTFKDSRRDYLGDETVYTKITCPKCKEPVTVHCQ